MIDSWHLPPVRILVAIAATVVAVAVLGVRSCADDGGDVTYAGDVTTTTSGPITTLDTGTASTTTSSIVILPDWYPKRTSRYSDREPVVTVTTLAPTTTTSTTTTRWTGSFTSGDRIGDG